MIACPLISVVIPTYNHERYILDTLNSVFAQTFRDYEVIVVNDGSPDDTAVVLQPLVASGRIRYFEQPNAGQASARNFGLAKCQGEFVAFLDDDDLWPADKLEWQSEVLRKSEAALVGGIAAMFRPGTPAYLYLAPRLQSMRLSDLARGCPFVSPGQTLIRRAALVQVGGFDPTIWGVDDFDLYLRLAAHGELLSEPRVSLQYRVHSANASKNRHRMLLNSLQVVRRHFPRARTCIARTAYRSLYVSCGREWMLAARKAIRELRFQSILPNLREVRHFLGAAAYDFVLARQIVLDLLPQRFSDEEQLQSYHVMGGVEQPAGPPPTCAAKSNEAQAIAL